MTDRIKRAVVDDLDTAAFPLKPVVPYGKPVHDRLRLEISRGCSRGCRFCQAGMIYRPVRERSPSNVLRLVKEGLAHTGYEDISLLSLSTGDYTCLTPLMMQLMVLCWKQRVAVSLPSIRAGALTPELMQLIRQVRKTGFTIAPEAGSQRLRDVINKNLTEEEIVNTVENAFSLGWKVIKLYFMIGLPTEAQEDLDAIVALVSRLKQIKGTGRKRGRLNVSITPFIPKAHTPFQWEAQIGTTETRKKIEYLKAKLNTPGVHFKWQNPDMSLLEGMISRGDRRVADIIENAWRLGCIFDGWSDRFDANRWQHAINESGISAEHFTKRARELDEPLPWDHMDSGINRLFLRQQHVAARKGEPISDCRYGDCHQCGICDFKTTSPKIFKHYSQPENGKREESQEGEHKQLALSYTKIDQARFFGHLEVAGMFARALRRSGVEVVYSRGFHPMPRISFENPIPLGMESLGERMRIKVGKNVTCRDLLEGLQRHMPEGIRITSCRPVSGQDAKLSQGIHRYRIFINSDKLDWSIWRRFQSMAAYPYQRTGKRGVGRSLDLKEFVQKATYNPKGWLQIHIASQSGVTLRPAEVLKVLFNVTAKEAATLKTVKLASADYHQES
ncbi:MAG: DUF2344 domain-containing protein [Desulfatitalea sp.]|nr:DUF2344 domain-containing protein [Desulfatitalea sp.]